MSEKNLKQKIEALLFIAREPLKISDIAKIVDAEESDIEKIVEELSMIYSTDDHGIHLINISDGYHFASKIEHAEVLQRYMNAPIEIGLSSAAMEALAIIAYRQPITRSEIEAIRGVNSDGIMRSLLDKELIEEQGRSEAIGKPTLYGTTEAFLKHFGLKNVEDLPEDPRLKIKESDKELMEKLDSFKQVSPQRLDFSKNIIEESAKSIIDAYEVITRKT